MNLMSSFKLAMRSIAGNKMRSFLTMLGIIIGVGSVIILISLMEGMTGSMTSVFDSMGTNLLTVSLNGRNDDDAVDVDEMYELSKENKDCIQAVSPVVNTDVTVKYGSESLSTTTTTGVGEDYAAIKDISITEGRFIQYVDIDKRTNVCVIGSYVAKELFEGIKPVGETLKIDGHSYTIVGVLEEKANSEESSTDDSVYIPYTNAEKLSWTGKITSYYISATATETVEQAKQELETYLYRVYGSEDYYTVSSMADAVSSVTELTGMMTMVLVGIASISLLVGGIGIMNIMLVSVTERTREIGIRKSMGAKRRDILSQFVIEAVVTASIGGLIGILTGSVCSVVIGNAIGLSAYPSVKAISLSFGVSFCIGVIFGYLPASKAAKLNPIDALRTE